MFGGYAYVVGIVLFALSLAGAGATGWVKGRDSRADEVSTLKAAIAVSKRLADDADARAKQASAQVVTIYKDRIKTVIERQPGETKLVEIIKRETPADCVLPPAYRQLWDGTAPTDGKAAQDSAGTDAAPVSVADAAETAAEAKRRFDQNAAKLAAIQSYLSKIDEMR